MRKISSVGSGQNQSKWEGNPVKITVSPAKGITPEVYVATQVTLVVFSIKRGVSGWWLCVPLPAPTPKVVSDAQENVKV